MPCMVPVPPLVARHLRSRRDALDQPVLAVLGDAALEGGLVRMYDSMPKAASKSGGDIERNHESSGIWLAWAWSDASFCSRKAVTSTSVVISASGMPSVSKNFLVLVLEALDPGFPRLGDLLLDPVTVGRRLEHPRSAGQLGGGVPHPVHLDVVRVPVAAVGVVRHQDVGRLLLEEGGETLRRLGHRRPPERGGMRRWPRSPSSPSRGSRGRRCGPPRATSPRPRSPPGGGRRAVRPRRGTLRPPRPPRRR